MRQCLIIASVLGALIIGFGAYCFVELTNIYKECFIEAGVALSPADFMKNPRKDAVFSKQCKVPDTTIPGDYEIEIERGFFTLHSTLHIQDTITPTCKGKEMTVEQGQVLNPEDFVENITDATKVTFSFAETPDFDTVGDQKITVLVTDLGNNTTECPAVLHVFPIHPEVTIEAGSGAPTLNQFVLEPIVSNIETDMSKLSFDTVADYDIEIIVEGKSYHSILHVRDTEAPNVVWQDVHSYITIKHKPEEFVASALDATHISYFFETEPDVEKEGVQELTVYAQDEGGNRTEGKVKLYLDVDNEMPVLEGVEPLEATVGDSISYKQNITYSDNCEEGLELIIDNSEVNVREEGVYPVIYTLRDATGNEVTKETTITIHPRMYDEKEVIAKADEIIASIITDDMTIRDKAKAIYTYLVRNVYFIEKSEKVDFIQGAYDGLVAHKGDCYSYACGAKMLLDRAGIRNEFISKVPPRPTSSHHYWNLVFDGEGWYHFDATPRSDHPVIFMWTESQLTAYSNQHYNCHNYDRSLYPAAMP